MITDVDVLMTWQKTVFLFYIKTHHDKMQALSVLYCNHIITFVVLSHNPVCVSSPYVHIIYVHHDQSVLQICLISQGRIPLTNRQNPIVTLRTKLTKTDAINTKNSVSWYKKGTNIHENNSSLMFCVHLTVCVICVQLIARVIIRYTVDQRISVGPLIQGIHISQLIIDWLQQPLKTVVSAQQW